MISALEHYSYCPRQCALIHVEQTFDENLYTLRGRRAHVRVDRYETETRPGLRAERALPLFSDRLGLIGRADLVEFRGETPYPVEFKHGKVRRHRHAVLQLCAQAMCLEEMLNRPVRCGALYFTSAHRRQEVTFTPETRTETETTIVAVRKLIRETHLPPPVTDTRQCRRCSLYAACLPETLSAHEKLRWWASALYRIEDEPDEP